MVTEKTTDNKLTVIKTLTGNGKSQNRKVETQWKLSGNSVETQLKQSVCQSCVVLTEKKIVHVALKSLKLTHITYQIPCIFRVHFAMRRILPAAICSFWRFLIGVVFFNNTLPFHPLI